jgi:hypothetical protein
MSADFKTTKPPYHVPAPAGDVTHANPAGPLHCAQETWKGNPHGA